MTLPIYIVSRANPERMHTPNLLRASNIPFWLVVDNKEQLRAAVKMGFKAFSTDTTDLVSKRNAITDEAKGWYIGMDDNVRGLSMVADEIRANHTRVDTSDPKAAPWRTLFNQRATPAKFMKGLRGLVKECERVGAEYGGLATMENPFFRMKRWGYRRFVKSKIFVMRGGSSVRFKHKMCHDSYASAHAVALHGAVAVDSWMFYQSNWYEKGGLGTRKEREAAGLLDQLQQCVDEFPGLVRLARGQNSALAFSLTSSNSVDAWRRKHGYLE